MSPSQLFPLSLNTLDQPYTKRFPYPSNIPEGCSKRTPTNANGSCWILEVAATARFSLSPYAIEKRPTSLRSHSRSTHGSKLICKESASSLGSDSTCNWCSASCIGLAATVPVSARLWGHETRVNQASLLNFKTANLVTIRLTSFGNTSRTYIRDVSIFTSKMGTWL